MTDLNFRPTLYIDQYELTMAQGYFFHGQKDVMANFDYFFRKIPFDGGYVVFAGLFDLLHMIASFRFEEDDIAFLREQGFKEDFLKYLGNFRFSGDIKAVPEGEIIFPNEPVVSIKAPIIEAQLLETIVLNMLNFQSLVATKAARIKNAAGGRQVIDFGLRRAQGLAGIHGSRAAVIGGAAGTSNMFSAQRYNLQVTGTMAHAWVQSFDSEYEAFSKFAETFPEKCILLADTYHTLNSGVPNAIKVAKEMEHRGQKLFGIRLDSGDLAYLSKKARMMLDEAGLAYVKITASNQLDEHVIESLLMQGAPLDAFGVGTKLITGSEDAALDGVYKLTQSSGKFRMKLSENIEKIILPGEKKLFRFYDESGNFYADGIFLSKENVPVRIFHPHQPSKHTDVTSFQHESLQRAVMKAGELLDIEQDIERIRNYASDRLSLLPGEYKRLKYPHEYKIGIGEGLMRERDKLMDSLRAAYL